MDNKLDTTDKMIAEGNRLLGSRLFYEHDHYDTWFGLYDKFREIPKEKNNLLLKYIWCVRISRDKPKYGIKSESDIISLAKICPDTCPINETWLDYGLGYNRVITQNSYGQKFYEYSNPSIDHIIPKSKFKLYGGDLEGDPNVLSNYKIVSAHANKIKNDHFVTEEDLDRWHRNMKKTYFGKII